LSKAIEIPKNKLRNLYGNEKLPIWKISKVFNCCPATVYKRLHKYGLKLTRADDLRVNLPRKQLEELYVKKKLSTWKIEKICGHSRGVVYSKLIKYGIKPRNLAESHIIYPRKPFDGDLKEKSYLIGFALGDLRVRKSGKNGETIKVDCGSTIPAQIDLIENLFKKYGHVWKSVPDERGKVQIEAFLDLSFSFLLDMKKEINSWILKDDECFIAFLAGFTDAEGSFFIGDGQGQYALGNYNDEILFLIRQKLMERDIKCAKITEDDKERITKDGYIRNQNYYQLRVTRKLSVLRLCDLIGQYLKHSKRINDMERIVENIKIRNEKFGVRS